MAAANAFVQRVLNDDAGESPVAASSPSLTASGYLPPSSSAHAPLIQHQHHTMPYPPPFNPYAPSANIAHTNSQRPSSAGSNGSIGNGFYYPSAADSRVSRGELWRMLANRIMYSHFYKALYVFMTVLALITIVMSFMQTCPTPVFIFLESVVNLTLILEVGMRFLATRRAFFSARSNQLDVVLVLGCLILYGMLLHDAQTCDPSKRDDAQRREALLDSVLLIIRNALQLARIATMLRKNQSQLAAQVASVDFAGLEGGGLAGADHTLLFDADDQLGFATSSLPAPVSMGSGTAKSRPLSRSPPSSSM